MLPRARPAQHVRGRVSKRSRRSTIARHPLLPNFSRVAPRGRIVQIAVRMAIERPRGALTLPPLTPRRLRRAMILRTVALDKPKINLGSELILLDVRRVPPGEKISKWAQPLIQQIAA